MEIFQLKTEVSEIEKKIEKYEKELVDMFKAGISGTSRSHQLKANIDKLAKKLIEREKMIDNIEKK